MTIFLIDDNSMYLKVTMEKIKAHCKQVFIFSSYKDALNNIRLNPDIIFLDYLFDDHINGELIFKKIKAANPDQHIVMVSAQEKADIVHQLVRLGIRDYIVKDENYIENMVETIESKKMSVKVST